ncbi:MAG TPA: hypothetical protein VFU49_19700 [Ktedonobacteraceae bacterium]|nr:hypothetical protein [Ktedonobacteraceae bacterium]
MMSSSGISSLPAMQEHLSTNSAAAIELSDEELTQVTGSDGWERMQHMHQGCHGAGRRIRLHATHLRIEWRLDWLNYNLRIN